MGNTFDLLAAKSAELLEKPIIRAGRKTPAGRAVLMAMTRTIALADQLSAEVRDGAVIETMTDDLRLLNTLIGYGFRGCTALAAAAN